jgi:methionyl-tRNA formyltransferase
MKIVFLTQDDPIYVLPFFDEFFRNYHNRFEITSVFCSRAMGKRKRLQLLKELLSLYGPVGFVRLVGQVVLARLLGKLPANKQSRCFHSLGQLCTTFNVPLLRVTSPNEEEVVSQIKCAGADVIVSVACPYILKESVLGAPTKACVNIHHAPLPNYRGMMPTFWQMLHGECRVGLTIHYMTPKLDEGNALLQDSLEIQTDETLHHLIRRSKRHGAHCMARALGQIEAGAASPIVLDSSKGSYFTFPTIAEMRKFHRKGFKAI